MRELRQICVFCGSGDGADPAYVRVAVRTGELLARRGIGLVYGGGGAGLMGAVSRAALDAGGEVTGYIPGALMDRESAHRGVGDLHVVATMHERKLAMAEHSDGFVALPGGVGTLEEVLEAFAWLQLGVHDKPVALLDVAGYYEPLVAAFDRAREAEFVAVDSRAMLLVDTDPGTLLDAMAAFERPATLATWRPPV